METNRSKCSPGVQGIYAGCDVKCRDPHAGRNWVQSIPSEQRRSRRTWNPAEIATNSLLDRAVCTQAAPSTLKTFLCI